MRRTGLRVAAVAALLFAFPMAISAGNPHEVHDTTIAIAGGTLTASGKEAGLGDETQVHIVLTATAACVNPGNNKPQAANKQTLTAEGDFPVQNGKAEFTLSVTATFQPSCVPPMSVEWSAITAVDETNLIQLYP